MSGLFGANIDLIIVQKTEFLQTSSPQLRHADNNQATQTTIVFRNVYSKCTFHYFYFLLQASGEVRTQMYI